MCTRPPDLDGCTCVPTIIAVLEVPYFGAFPCFPCKSSSTVPSWGYFPTHGSRVDQGEAGGAVGSRAGAWLPISFSHVWDSGGAVAAAI